MHWNSLRKPSSLSFLPQPQLRERDDASLFTRKRSGEGGRKKTKEEKREGEKKPKEIGVGAQLSAVLPFDTSLTPVQGDRLTTNTNIVKQPLTDIYLAAWPLGYQGRLPTSGDTLLKTTTVHYVVCLLFHLKFSSPPPPSSYKETTLHFVLVSVLMYSWLLELTWDCTDVDVHTMFIHCFCRWPLPFYVERCLCEDGHVFITGLFARLTNVKHRWWKKKIV